MNPVRLQAWILRAVGAVELPAFVSVVIPRTWMEAGHEWLGMGTMPAGPLLDFMIRQASFTYGLHAVALIFISFSVNRYRPLIVLTAIGYLAASPVFLAIDLATGMPGFWAAGDTVSCALVGGSLLFMDRMIAKTTA